MKRPFPLPVVAGVVVLTVMPVLLLRAMFSDFGSGNPIVWVNPNLVRAGFGFAGLALALGVGALVYRARGVPLGPRSLVLGAVLLAGGLGGMVAHRPLVSLWASYHGYQRCKAEDRLHAGNVRRNDVMLQAWALRCQPARVPAE